MYSNLEKKSTVAVCNNTKTIHNFVMFLRMCKFVHLHILKNCCLESASNGASQFPKVWPKWGVTTVRSRLCLFKLGFYD